MRLLHAIVCAGACLISVPGIATAAPPPTVNVPVMHAETNGLDAVQFVAAQRSGGQGQVLVVYGKDAAALHAIMQVAGEAITAGYPLKGVIFGPRRDDAPFVVEFYADAQLTATFLNAKAGDKATIQAEVVRGYRDIVMPRLAKR